MKIGVLVVAAAFSLGASAADSPPPQPIAELDIVAAFERSRDALFEEYVSRRPEILHLIELGTVNEPTPECFGMRCFFEFRQCTDSSEPRLKSYDVRKTDSILSPFIGVITVERHTVCSLRRLVPKSGLKQWDTVLPSLFPYCLGHTYQECMSSGKARPAGFAFSNCTGGAGETYTIDDEIDLLYRWSHGAWEFDREAGAKE